MAKEPGTPITLRIPEDAIESLKRTARRWSLQMNKDITYVDLIRKAIGDKYSIDIKDDVSDEPEKKNSKLIIPDDSRGFWTRQDINEFDASEIGKKFALAIQLGQYAEIAQLWLEQWELWVNENSVAYKLLRTYSKLKEEEHAQIVRDVVAIAHVVSRRGSIPYQLIEPESIIVPSFEIGAAPEMRLSELKPFVLFSTMCSTIKAWQRELDTNVLSALIAAAAARGSGMVKKPSQGGMDSNDFEYQKGTPDQVKQVQSFNAADILWGVKQVAQHQLIPSAIVVHPERYCDLHSFGRDFIDAPPLKVALEHKEYGSVLGIPVMVSSRLDRNTILVCGAPHEIGAVIETAPPRINFTDIPHKKRVSIVESGELAIAVINDYAIAVIEIKEE